MADSNFNPAQNLSDEDRSKGGQNSPSKFGSPQGADPSAAGSKGAEAQSTEDKAKGGRNSHSGGNNS